MSKEKQNRELDASPLANGGWVLGGLQGPRYLAVGGTRGLLLHAPLLLALQSAVVQKVGVGCKALKRRERIDGTIDRSTF